MHNRQVSTQLHIMFFVCRSRLSSKCLVEGRELGSVVCVGWFVGNGGTHLAVGRHDGSIQLYLIDLENIAKKPRLKFTYVSYLLNRVTKL